VLGFTKFTGPSAANLDWTWYTAAILIKDSMMPATVTLIINFFDLQRIG
jgi:hypothetical protein